MLSGTVELVDECYVGGKPPGRTRPTERRENPPKCGRGTSKQPVMVLVERDGSSRAMPIEPYADGETLIGAGQEAYKRIGCDCDR